MLEKVIKVAVQSPIDKVFDYLPPLKNTKTFLQGQRVEIPFGTKTRIGIVHDIVDTGNIERKKLKRVHAIIDETPLLDSDILSVLQWAHRYYHYPQGQIYFHAIPTQLRNGKTPSTKKQPRWFATSDGKNVSEATLKNAPKQASLINFIRQSPDGKSTAELDNFIKTWRSLAKALQTKGLIEVIYREAQSAKKRTTPSVPLALNTQQQEAVERVCDSLNIFNTFLLEGVTGSGKTEVYLQTINFVLKQNKQVIILTPEIGLTGQLITRFEQRFQVPIVTLHSKLSDSDRALSWLQAAQDKASIIIGTRSAVFTPAPRLGLIILDEEHDASFKQQEGFRYHARDLALVRARLLKIPVILGSATPSLESIKNMNDGRFIRLPLTQRISEQGMPKIVISDIGKQKLVDNVSHQLKCKIKQHLDQDNQVLVFLNRRGFAPTVLCQDCGWIVTCKNCHANMVWHKNNRALRCHHCYAGQPEIKKCLKCEGQNIKPLGFGTERMETILNELFTTTEIIRIDRDSTVKKGSLDRLLSKVASGKNQILLGTQMLAKGHDFPNITLVVVFDTDQGLFGADFRSAERMGQLITQVAGRAGRAEKPGEVYIQTLFPQHPLLRALITHDYRKFADSLLNERSIANLPPYCCLAVIRAESIIAKKTVLFLNLAKDLAQPLTDSSQQVLGPIPSLMEKRRGQYRAQLLIQAKKRSDLHRLLDLLLPQLNQLDKSKKLRWSIDVDPLELL